MDTKIWTDESDNYTQRAIETFGDKLYENTQGFDFKNEAYKRINTIISNPKNILDIGCAFGVNIYALKDKFKESFFFGIDPGKESISIANENLANNRISFINGFSHDLPYEDNKFDVIILSMVLQWIPRKQLIRTISEVDRVLKVGGGGSVYTRIFN